MTARLVAAPLSELLGKPVIINARPGAGGNLATEYVARRPPDGYSLALLVGGHAVSAALYNKLPFDPVGDLAFISAVSVNPFVMVVRKESPIRDVADLIARAKAEPGKITFSSAGVGTTQHLVGELFAQEVGIELTHIPYKGGSQPLTDLFSGQIDMMIDTIAVTKGSIDDGRLRALGVTSIDPWPALASVPTVASRIPGFSVMSWIGFAAPAKTPDAIVGRINSDLRRVMAGAELQKKLEDLGGRATVGTPEELRALVVSEIARWNQVIDKAKIPRR